MTYGESTAALRAELATLLGHQRIQHRLGGPGPFGHGDRSSVQEREALGVVLRCYRRAILVWCEEALWAVSIKNDPAAVHPKRRTAIERLQVGLRRATTEAVPGMRLVSAVPMRHRFELARSWQRAAVAASLGERDFSADFCRGALTLHQVNQVVRDVSEVVEAVTLLDRSYGQIPGWLFIPDQARLGQAAALVRSEVSARVCDVRVDARGFQSAGEVLAGSADRVGGISRVLAAQRQTLAELAQLPSALNLRRVLLLQGKVSSVAAARTLPDDLDSAIAFEERADVYRRLSRQTRDLGGIVGGGAGAVISCERALRALEELRDPMTALDAHRLRRVLLQVDDRVGDVIDRGAGERMYFTAVSLPYLNRWVDRGVVRPRVRYVPTAGVVDEELRSMLRRGHRTPVEAPPSPPTGCPSPRPDQRDSLRRALQARSERTRSR